MSGLTSNIDTLPAHRGQGHARAVTEELLRWLREQTDVSRVDLFATPEGARIHERLGFVDVGHPALRLRVHR